MLYRDISMGAVLSKLLTASIVLYNHAVGDVRSLFETLAEDPALSEWVVVDNGGSEEACAVADRLGARCIRPDRNRGFGAGHNIALHALASSSPYHLIVNPDISFKCGALAELANVLDALPEVGVVMPRILYPDGSMQYLCKLLPSPVDLFLRRFGARRWNWFFRDRMDQYDMKFFDYSRAAYVPVLSGCFMFARRSILDAVGGFDERFFLYMEDVDLCRRAGAISRLLFWPWITVTHGHTQGSYKSARLLRLHILAAIAYFNKWGWIKDADRIARNKIGLTEAYIDPESLNRDALRASLD